MPSHVGRSTGARWSLWALFWRRGGMPGGVFAWLGVGHAGTQQEGKGSAGTHQQQLPKQPFHLFSPLCERPLRDEATRQASRVTWMTCPSLRRSRYCGWLNADA
jgi:hypothetical protein